MVFIGQNQKKKEEKYIVPFHRKNETEQKEQQSKLSFDFASIQESDGFEPASF